MPILRRRVPRAAVGPKGLALPTSMTPAPRIYRCRRCSGRKFRTPRDLALHILAKHGHAKQSIGLPSESIEGSDAHSITFMSPVINGSNGDDVEVNHFIKEKHSKGDSNFSREFRPMSSQCRSHIVKRAEADATTARRPRVHERTISSEPSNSSHNPVSSILPSPQLQNLKPPSVRIPRPVTRMYEGESTGPLAQDIYVQRCRDGRIPLVPANSQPVKTLNFAQGFF